MTLIRIVSVIALLSYVLLLILIRGELRRKEVRSFALFLVGMLVWQLGATAATFTSNPEVAEWCYKVVVGLGSMWTLFYAQFARDYLRIHKHRWIMQFGYLWLVVSSVYILAGGPYVIEGIAPMPGTGFLVPELGPVALIQATIAYAFLFYAAANLILRYRQISDPPARARIRYLVVGVLLVFFGSISNLNPGLRGYPIDMVANVLNAALIAITILRLDLFEIGRAVRAGLAYAIPTATITAIYFGTIYLAVTLLHLAFGVELFLGILVVSVALSLLLEPLRSVAQAKLDQIFFRDKYDMGQMLQRLSRTVASVLDVQQVSAIMLAEITTTMHVTRAALLLQDKDGGNYRPLAERGFDGQAQVTLLGEDNPIARWLVKRATCLARHIVLVEPQFVGLWSEERLAIEQAQVELFVPLLVGEDLVGILVLGPKRSEVPYSPEEELILLTLANQTAVAVQNARLYQAALEEKERTETIVQQAFSGIMVIDPSMRIVAWNRGAETITGYASGEILGQRLSEVFGAELWGEESALKRTMVTGQTQLPVELGIGNKNDVRDVLLGVTPLRDGYLLNFTDVTHLKEVDRLKSNIVSNVSHELRTPLALIKGYTELLIDGYEDDDQGLRLNFLSIIDSETDRLAGFINDLLDLSRLQSGRVEQDFELLDLGKLIKEVAMALEIQGRQNNTLIRLEIPDDLPPILASSDLMLSMTRNLIGNAIKYSPDGREVRIQACAVGGQFILNVIDQGIGIAPEDLPQLFTRFYRSWTARQSGLRGTGLGLVLVKEAVELHGGTITVESQLHVGTRFTVTLPIPSAERTAKSSPVGLELQGAAT